MQTLTLFHPESFPIAQYSDALQRESIATRQIAALEALGSDPGALRVVLIDPVVSLRGGGLAVTDSRTAIVGIGLREQPAWLNEDSVYLQLPEAPSTAMLLSAVKRAYQFLYQKLRADHLERELTERTSVLRQVSEVGAALSTVRDHSVLLTMILTKARELSRADAGSLYMLDDDDSGQKVLRWKLAQNDSIEVDFEERELQITRKSLAGYVAMTGETLVIDDAYDLPADAEYSINRSFDEENEYLTKSILAFPMTTHTGDTVGVLQLINRKRVGAPKKLSAATVPDEVIPFEQEIIEVMRALAGQAGVAVENNVLYDSIERLFEGFVTAAITAIEQRDPTTSGHSFRVADLTVELAKIVDGIDYGSYTHTKFTEDQLREVRYASLLHDFGKVGVREQVLVKEKKLYPMQLDAIRARFEFAIRSVENDANKRKLDYILANGRDGYEAFARSLDEESAEQTAKLHADFAFISKSNEPTVLPEGEFQHLMMVAELQYDTLRGERNLLLQPEEARILSIRKGNLDAAERQEIESHVTHTFNFLAKIPWTRDLKFVPSIAYAHHEKMNGKGYPRRLPAADIPVQARMMTVADIYDALTASDRPYKKAIPTDRALDILRMETSDGLLDHELVDVFIDAKVFERAGVMRTA